MGHFVLFNKNIYDIMPEPNVLFLSAADGVTVAAGCCGEGAATCDEIGRLAAYLAINQIWDSRVPREMFKADLIN